MPCVVNCGGEAGDEENASAASGRQNESCGQAAGVCRQSQLGILAVLCPARMTKMAVGHKKQGCRDQEMAKLSRKFRESRAVIEKPAPYMPRKHGDT